MAAVHNMKVLSLFLLISPYVHSCASRVRCPTEHQAPGAVFILTTEVDSREDVYISLRVRVDGSVVCLFELNESNIPDCSDFLKIEYLRNSKLEVTALETANDATIEFDLVPGWATKPLNGSCGCNVTVATQSDGDCPLSDLLSNLSSVNQSNLPLLTLCESNSTFCNFTSDEGTLFFNGNQNGSVAIYIVSDGYCLNSAPVRVCEDGVWSNEVVLETARVRCPSEHQAPGAVFILTVVAVNNSETANMSLGVTNDGSLACLFQLKEGNTRDCSDVLKLTHLGNSEVEVTISKTVNDTTIGFDLVPGWAIGPLQHGSCPCNVSVVTQSDGNCPLSDLLSNLSSVNQSDLPLLTLCESNSSFCNITVDEGTVFFNGNRSGSIAFYNASNAYCLNSARVRVCEDGVWSNEVVFEAVATEHCLQAWNIALIVTGAVAYVIGSAVGAGLGTWLAVKSATDTDMAISIAMMVVSVLLIPPVSGPVAMVTFLLLKYCRDSQKVEMIWWYKILNAAAIFLNVVGMLLWLVQANYSTKQDFYGDGPLRDKNGMCVPHEANEKEMLIQDVLVILLSVAVMVGLIFMAILSKLGTKKSKESSPSTSEDEGL